MAKRTAAVLLICVFLISSFVTVQVQRAKADSPKTIVVPDDYSTIQAAIDAANAGDTVFVRAGNYKVSGYDGLSIGKSISLVGENSQNTVINADWEQYQNIEVEVTADHVTVSGFTIDTTNYDFGLDVHGSDCEIVENNIGRLYVVGINDAISGNNLTLGAYVYSNNSLISGNHILGNNIGGSTSSYDCGLMVYGQNITIVDNNLIKNGLWALDSNSNSTLLTNGGLGLSGGPFWVYGNNMTKNDYGIIIRCSHSDIFNNNFINNRIGVFAPVFDFTAPYPFDNKVYNNNLIDNQENAIIQYNNSLTGNFSDFVSWDNGYVGNYWSDYESRYSNASQVDSLGIGNTPYVIDANNIDHYPLMNQVDITAPVPTPPIAPSPSEPEFPAFFIFAIVVVATASVIAFKKRARNNAFGRF